MSDRFAVDVVGALRLSLTHPTSNAIVALTDADRELLLDVLWVNEHQVLLDDPDWGEQVEEAFQ
jgi:hypothetical protein